jgi:hypothetical protein
VKTVLKDAMGYSGLEDIKVNVGVAIPPKTNFYVPSCFIDDHPVHDAGGATKEQGAKGMFRLSDAAVAMAFDKGYATVVDFTDRKKE